MPTIQFRDVKPYNIEDIIAIDGEVSDLWLVY